jgi:hypothetical protein
MGSLALQQDTSRVQPFLLTTLGLLFATLVGRYISGVLYRRNSRPRQDGINVIVDRNDAEIEYILSSH